MTIVRYFFVGAMAAAVDLALFMLLARVAAWPWFYAALASFIAATLVNYVLSVRHVFQSGVRFSRGHELALVFAVSAAGLAVNQLVLWLMIERVGAPLLLSKVTATGVVFAWNYAARRYFVFRSPRAPAPGGETLAGLPPVAPGRGSR